jgi:hypothetical protein
MKVIRDEKGLTATEMTLDQMVGLVDQLSKNDIKYTLQNSQLNVTFEDMYANLPQVDVPAPRHVARHHS